MLSRTKHFIPPSGGGSIAAGPSTLRSPLSRSFSTTSRQHARTHGVSHYDALKLPKNATKQQVKARFYELSKQYHPDAKGGDTAKFHEINDAYATLGDESKRRQYDLSLVPASQASRPTYTTGHSSFRPNDPYLHRHTQGPHRAWHNRPGPSSQSQGAGPSGSYAPFGRKTPPNYQYSYEYNYTHNPNVRTTDRSGWGKRGKSAQAPEEEHVTGGGVWRFIVTVGLIFFVISLGGGLTANTESVGEYVLMGDEKRVREDEEVQEDDSGEGRRAECKNEQGRFGSGLGRIQERSPRIDNGDSQLPDVRQELLGYRTRYQSLDDDDGFVVDRCRLMPGAKNRD
ncbi:hypothetical protein IAR55_006088 [Kwoniella newhampshirensis]|uniref:J domain-containing protein n=1 Tax=Kwoniella newhampshirensis TaxID=1651941 RepID=A0AAW0YUN6_9TREE